MLRSLLIGRHDFAAGRRGDDDLPLGSEGG